MLNRHLTKRKTPAQEMAQMLGMPRTIFPPQMLCNQTLQYGVGG